MDVQVVQHEMPLRRFGITGNQALEMGQGILLGAGRSRGGFDDVPCDDIKIDEPRQDAMSDVLEFPSQHMAGQHRQVGMLALYGLDTGQLVHADGAFPGSGIHLTPLDNLFIAVFIGHLG